MAALQTLTIPIQGMDCAECTQHVGQAISKLDGVASVDVLLATEKAIIRLDPAKVTMPALRKAVASAGDYSVPEGAPTGSGEKEYPVAREGVYILRMPSGIFNSTVHSLSSGNGKIFTISAPGYPCNAEMAQLF